MKWLKPLLFAAGIGHVVLGLYFLYEVDAVARLLGFDLLNTGARGELRALAGGLVVALGAAVLRGAIGGRFGRQWLYAVGGIYSGLLAGRVVSLGMDGLAAHTLFAGLFEAALAVLFFWSGAEIGRSSEIVGEARQPEAPAEPAAGPTASASASAALTPAVDDELTSGSTSRVDDEPTSGSTPQVDDEPTSGSRRQVDDGSASGSASRADADVPSDGDGEPGSDRSLDSAGSGE